MKLPLVSWFGPSCTAARNRRKRRTSAIGDGFTRTAATTIITGQNRGVAAAN